MTRIKTHIARCRYASNMKQEDLAALVGVRRETICRLEQEQSNPSLKLAMDIAKVFNMPVESLFEFIEDDKKK